MYRTMYLLAAFLLLFSSRSASGNTEQVEHRDFQYNSVVDPATGRYNFAYDTGNDNDIAHSMHMQYRDANGMVRGRYGYTDPRGKLRVVEYEAGPDGFVARGDVGVDQSMHDQTPETQPPLRTANYAQGEDLQLSPRPVQMAGWDPEQNPMGQPIADALASGTETADGSSAVEGYSTTNVTNSDGLGTYVPVLDPYDERYPRLIVSTNENSNGRELESSSSSIPGDQNNSEATGEPYPVAPPVTINNIDVNPDEIREAASGQSPTVTVGRSADGDSTTVSRTSSSTSRALPYSYRRYRYYRPTHDHYGEIASPYRSVYIPSHGHYHYERQPHDHDAERRYYANRQTHDHDAERRYYVSRQTHDHDAEKKYASSRQTHDHDAERRWYYYNNNNRYTHDHDGERARGHYYYDTLYHQNNPNRRRIYYKDDHSQVPHEHYNDIYHNGHDRSHQHSDVHLYGTTSTTESSSQNLQVPPTARPGQLKYISSDKYHDKYYYWTD